MNKGTKAILVLTIFIASTITISYAVKPEEPNLTVLVQSILDYLEDVVTPSIDTLETDLESHVTAEIDDIDARIAGIPVMVAEAGKSSELTGLPDSDTLWIYESPLYPNGAIFNVVVTGSLSGPGGFIVIYTLVPYETGYSADVLVGKITDDLSTTPAVLEFPGKQCTIKVWLPAGETYSSMYYVTTTYIP